MWFNKLVLLQVRQQIKQEIRDEIEKQRKQVLEDPELKSQLMELEALRQSKVSKSESGIKPVEDKFVKEQDKHKQVCLVSSLLCCN